MHASRRRTRANVLAATFLSVAACTGGAGESETASAGQRAANLPSTDHGEEIPMSWIDPHARYFLLSVKPMPHDRYEALTRRQGTGIFYARREIDCHGARRFRFIGMGDTREEAQRDVPNPGEMAEPVEGSTNLGVVQYVCRKVAR
jgi:hypothetical protein